MVGTFTDFAGRTALSQLRSQPQFKRGDYTGALLDTARGKGASTSSGGFFTVQSGMRSEASVFRALGDGLGKARGAIAAAETGTRALSSVLDRVDRVIGAVEAGAPGSSFKSALDGLQQQAEIAIARGGYAGTNLLKEGEALTVTLGFKGNSTTDFRQLSIEAVGLSPTDAARQTTTVTQTVTETVETPVTRGELLTERVERLENRINNITSH